MRVLLANDSSSLSGGAEVMTLRIAEYLRRRGHEVRVFSSDVDTGGGPPQADYLCANIRSKFYLNTLHNFSAASRLKEAVNDFRPDLIHVRMFLTQLSPAILPVVARVPSMAHVVWYRAICPTGLKMLPDGSRCTVRRGVACLTNGCLKPVDWAARLVQLQLFERRKDAFRLYLANSRAVGVELEKNGLGPVRVLWNAVPIRPQRDGLDAEPSLLYVGRLAEGKGLDVLLKAVRGVLDTGVRVRLDIVGSGPERRNLEQMANSLGLGQSVRFHGHLPQRELEENFRGAWAQIVPSVWPEPFGISAAEAMMRGIPVIAARSGGLAEFIQNDRTGILVSPGSAEELSTAILRMVGDKPLADRLGQFARQFAIDYLSEKPFTDQLLEAYEAVLSNSRPVMQLV